MTGMVRDLDTRTHWEGLRQHTLLVQRCSACALFRWQPRQLCHLCQSWEYEWVQVSGLAYLYSWTVIHNAPPPFSEETPYTIAMVTLTEQADLVMIGRLINASEESLRPGMALRVRFRDKSEGDTLAGWEPISDASAS
jgi:uncharacterized protein